MWYLPTIVLGEFRYGIMGSNKGAELELWLDTIEEDCTILVPDGTTARLYGRMRQEIDAIHRVVPYHDIWIAALAAQHDLPVVSRDDHFDYFPGVRRIAW